MEKIKNFWDLDWQEREKIVSQRTKGQKWVVWDYSPNKNGEVGVIEKCPQYWDKSFPGYYFPKTEVCLPITFSICPYTDEWYGDETELSKGSYYHIFSTYEQALKYAELVRLYHSPKELTLEGILPLLKPYFKDARITKGKRGYENTSKEYECIVANGGWTTFKIRNGKHIEVQMGQLTDYIIPHTDLIEKCFTNIPKGHYMNYFYAINDWDWTHFYES